MMNFSKFQSNAIALVCAFAFSAIVIGASIGPAASTSINALVI